MTVRDLISALDLQVLTEGDLDLPIENGYCGDLLSWVMGRMPHGSVWFTIMSNRNVLAVAVLAEAPAIVLCEGVVPDEDVLEKALRYAGYDVKRVMNITDVGHLSSDADTGEDKMLAGAKREHKSVMEIADFYTKAFFDDCEKLNIKRPDVV